MKKLFLILTMLVAVAALPSCSFFQSACGKAMPILVAAQAYSTDAQQAIDKVQRAVDQMNLPAEKKAVVQAAIDKAQLGLRAANIAVTTAVDACKAPDLATMFKEFVEAWIAMKTLFGTVAPEAIGAGPGQLQLEDPAIVRKVAK